MGHLPRGVTNGSAFLSEGVKVVIACSAIVAVLFAIILASEDYSTKKRYCQEKATYKQYKACMEDK